MADISNRYLIGTKNGAIKFSIIVVLLFVTGCGSDPSSEQVFNPEHIAPFVEPDFPFITTSVDARELGPAFPDDNITPRCLALRLGEEAFACFDTDMLRWSAAWTGEFLPMVTMAQISYRDFHNKNNEIPEISGEPKIATGLYPGWSGSNPEFTDPRPSAPNSGGRSWGPIPQEMGRWNGIYLQGRDAVMSYTVQGSDIFEKPGSLSMEGETAFTRTIRIDELQEPLSLVVAEVSNGTRSEITDSTAFIYHGENGESLTAIGLADNNSGVELNVTENRYATGHISSENKKAEFTLVIWHGPANEKELFDQMLDGANTEMSDFRDGGPPHWSEEVHTSGKLAPDTAAYVTDRLTLPVPNPWKRNVRVTDVGFFGPHKAAMVTFGGDVWIVEGIDRELDDLTWSRYASGLYEPQSLEVVDDTVYVFGREGIVKFHDLNDDGVADYYENFSNLMVQSIESREWPTGLAADPNGGFYVSKFGPLDMGPQTSSPRLMPGFRAGSQHGGSVLKVSSDGRSVKHHATGFRGAYLGINPETGVVSASDQQGHFVPSTAIMLLSEGDYYGVPATAHRDPAPEISRPLTWIPHNVDRSGTSQVWITDERMGPLKDKIVHFSYGRPGLFQVIIDSTENAVQGGVSFIPGNYTAPAMKGAIGPHDGQLYVTGFNIWDTNAEDVSAFIRLRYTGLPSPLPTDFSVYDSGVILRFDSALDEQTAGDPGSYQVKRWNYQRSEEYGSGHFKLDGTPGEDLLPVFSAHLSEDKQSVFLVIPNMEEVMQMEISYAFETEGEAQIEDGFWFTVNDLAQLDLTGEGFENLNVEELMVQAENQEIEEKEEQPATVERGKELFQRTGCQGCHAVSASQTGKTAPPVHGLFGTTQEFEDGTTTIADEAYIRESLLDPNTKMVKGYERGMPPFRGILSEAEIESIILYIKSLSEDEN